MILVSALLVTVKGVLDATDRGTTEDELRGRLHEEGLAPYPDLLGTTRICRAPSILGLPQARTP
jgi:hypothetical protein